jgi:hypothetical protein
MKKYFVLFEKDRLFPFSVYHEPCTLHQPSSILHIILRTWQVIAKNMQGKLSTLLSVSILKCLGQQIGRLAARESHDTVHTAINASHCEHETSRVSICTKQNNKMGENTLCYTWLRLRLLLLTDAC